MTHDELAELMSEPPGGHNHGRKRGAEGGWRSLEEHFETALPYIVDDPEWGKGRRRKKNPLEIRHGTRHAYTVDRCRCEICRKANAEYIAAYRRSRDVR